MKPVFFSNQLLFRKWLEKNHLKKSELFVGYYKIGSNKPSMTWSQSVDQALCFGWIDGVRRSIDKNSYQIRFTPRRPSSIWSAINIKKVDALTKQGLMKDAGLTAFKLLKSEKSKIYSHENPKTIFSPKLVTQFKKNKRAWIYFQSLAPSYQKISINWVMSAKQEATRKRRMNALIAESEAGKNPWKRMKQ